MPPLRSIQLRGVAVHNLKQIDLDLPHQRLIVVCGVSGSGKSSLAFDTLYAEGQRRYIESFSAYTRQFLDRLEKPDAERIDGIPPAIAVVHDGGGRSSRSTVATATEAADYLRLLFAKVGEMTCPDCGRVARRDTPQSVARWLQNLPAATRVLVAFPASNGDEHSLDATLKALREDGFVRAIVGSTLTSLQPIEVTRQVTAECTDEYEVERSPECRTEVVQEPGGEAIQEHAADSTMIRAGDVAATPGASVFGVVDRLTAGGAEERARDSLEIAFGKGNGTASILIESSAATVGVGLDFTLDGRDWRLQTFSAELRCCDCGFEFPEPEPRLFSFNSPLGACPQCEGFGNILDIDHDLVIPDPGRTLRDGAIAPWNTPAYAHELKELLALAPDYGLPDDVPYRDLSDEHRRLIEEGVPERNFGGLRGFFAWLERRKYKMHIRVFLSRWRSDRTCPACHGARLRPEALLARVGGLNLAEIAALKVRDALAFFRELTLSEWQRSVGRMMLEQVISRLHFLQSVGLGYLTLDRSLRTLSGGEAQRVSLTSALGSSLVHMLYVLDEPSAGLHPHDTDRLLTAVSQLRDRGNTVVVVEHDEAFLRAADQLVEIGPGAGERGGKLVFQGPPSEIEDCPQSITGDYLAGRRRIRLSGQRRQPNHGWIRLAGARGNNLHDVTVEFPLGLLCVVTGPSGSGKSTLVQDTLYPALCRRLRKDAPKPLPYDDVYGDGQIDDVILVDQSPIGRSPRSNPVTYVKAFDEIRAVFADTLDARTRNYTASHFSFNSEAGRCGTCAGEGYRQIDMQFLADVYMPCSQCHGTRYRREILDVTYRGRHIADVLDMTVREAFTFFRGHAKVQARLKRLIDVGLDYLRLGQPANTLSSGEAQRLKLAVYTSSARRGRCLFLLDEPTVGLHFSDIVQLLDCFDSLLAVGHSLIVVEHDLELIKSADYVIDLGPGAADEGGQIMATGTPEAVSRQNGSVTARYLAQTLAREAEELPA